MKIHCPECGSPMKRPKEPVQFDNSMFCKNGHKFDVFNVGGYITIRGYMDDQELRDRLSAIHKKVREDPEIIERKRKLAKELGTLSQEQLDRVVRGSVPTARKES